MTITEQDRDAIPELVNDDESTVRIPRDRAGADRYESQFDGDDHAATRLYVWEMYDNPSGS